MTTYCTYPRARHGRRAWLWLLAVALLLRGLIPAGYMPTFGGGDTTANYLSFSLCHGDGGLSPAFTQWLNAQQETAPEEADPHLVSPCIFSATLAQVALPHAAHIGWSSTASTQAVFGQPMRTTARTLYRWLPIGARAPPAA